jgi:hypothetical protein
MKNMKCKISKVSFVDCGLDVGGDDVILIRDLSESLLD